MLTAARISTTIRCGDVQFSAEPIEFSFDSFVEFGREKLQSHDRGTPDDFLRHAGDHVVAQLRERGRDRFHAASNAESPGDSLALIARPRLFDSLYCGDTPDL